MKLNTFHTKFLIKIISLILKLKQKINLRHFHLKKYVQYFYSRLKMKQKNTLYKHIKLVIVTAPAYFNSAQIKAIENAGSIAELKILLVGKEPAIAALAYGLGCSFDVS